MVEIHSGGQSLNLMKMKCYFDKDGVLLNIGEWDRKVRPAYTEPDTIEPEVNEPEVVKDGKVVSQAVFRPARLIQKGRDIPEVVGNEIPAGVIVEEREILVTPHGRFLASDYAALRRNEYPDIRDQIDAIWKGGSDADAMREKVIAVKTKYPKA